MSESKNRNAAANSAPANGPANNFSRTMDELSKQMKGLELNSINSSNYREKQAKVRKLAATSARLKLIADAEAAKAEKEAKKVALSSARGTRRAKRSEAKGNMVSNANFAPNSGKQTVKGASTRKVADPLKKKVRELTTELAAAKRELTSLEKTYKETALAAFESEGDAEKKAAATSAKSAVAEATAKVDKLKSDLTKAKEAAGVPAGDRMETINE